MGEGDSPRWQRASPRASPNEKVHAILRLTKMGAMVTTYPRLLVPARPSWTSRDGRNATATNRYSVFRHI
jgi:hypothetical protein